MLWHKMIVLVLLVLVPLTVSQGVCPSSNPFAYSGGLYCCKHNREKVYAPQGARCDGSIIGIDSTCCKNDEAAACPNGTCSDYPVDECTLGIDDCHGNATCTNTDDAYTCECNDGFRGNGKECYDHRVFTVECHELWVAGYWERVNFQAQRLDLYVGDQSCGNYSQNATHIWVQTNFTDCGSIIREQGNMIFQQASAYITASYITGIMQRQVRYRYNMGCQFDRTLNISSVDGFATGIDEGGEVNLTRSTNFQAELQLYETALFNTPKNPLTFSSFQPMYVMVKETNTNPSLKMIVQQCFATADSDINGPNYLFFGLKCPIDTTFQTLSSTNDHFQFTLEAFTFLEITSQIHIHCTLYICKVGSTNPDCQQQCQRNGRKRREISNLRQRRDVTNEPPVEEMTVASKTIYFKKKPTCKDTTCPTNSHCLELYPAACRCNAGFIWNRETRNCSVGHAIIVRGVNLDMEIPTIYADPKSSVFNRFAMDFEDGVNKLVERDTLNSKKILGSKVLSLSPTSNTLDISILRHPSVLDSDTFKYFTETVVVELDSYPMNKNSQPKVYDISDTTVQMNNKEQPQTNIVIIKTERADAVGIEVIIPVVVAAVVVPTLCCLLFVFLRRRKRSSEDKNAVGMENKGVDAYE